MAPRGPRDVHWLPRLGFEGASGASFGFSFGTPEGTQGVEEVWQHPRSQHPKREQHTALERIRVALRIRKRLRAMA